MTDTAVVPATVPVTVHGPYEELAIEAIRLLTKIIDSQPKDVQAELWKGYLEDVRAWREFWRTFRRGLGDAFIDSATPEKK